MLTISLVLGRAPSKGTTQQAVLPGQRLSTTDHEAIIEAIHLMLSKKLTKFAGLSADLDKQGRWRSARPNDEYLTMAEKAGDTPFAYTLPDDSSLHHPIAIVLAPRFFTDTTPAARAALMIHELGHWQAFVARGNSTEFDGYKTEFDVHKQLGLKEKDGLTYFMMLDGVDRYVAPVLKAYASELEVKAYKAGE